MPEFGRIDADTVGMLSTACRKDDMQAASENIKKQPPAPPIHPPSRLEPSGLTNYLSSP